MGNINEHDMTKRMLDRLRGGTQSNNTSLSEDTKVESELINEHDRTKDMLNTIRGGNVLNEVNNTDRVNGRLLTENEYSNDVIKVDESEISEESAKFRDTVGGVDLKLYEVYPKEKNVVMVGVLDNGIEFKFSKKELAPYINAHNIRLDDETVELIKRLHGNYVTWSSEWNDKIGEYIQSA